MKKDYYCKIVCKMQYLRDIQIIINDNNFNF